ncbi:MAG: hypothetical protein ACKVPX_14480 [Myxococcaceae bacterium]
MRWVKRGKLFDPTAHRLPNRCVEFAQSPQALVFPDFIRIYFSTREKDEATGKYLSHVAFADFNPALEGLLRVSDKPVIPLGGLGAFDEHGIFPMNVLRHEGRVLAYTTGWSRRVSVSVETAIGFAESTDGGETFRRRGEGPILAASLYEPFLVGDAFVRVFRGKFHMWYIFGTSWRTAVGATTPERTYKIGHATSHDGETWIKEEGRAIVSDRVGPDESQALPTVIDIDGTFHMFFCYRQSFDFRTHVGRGYQIGHAWSRDLVHWARDDATLTLDGTRGDWDSDMLCYPHVFEARGRVHLLYNGNAFGRHGFGWAVLEK